LFKFIEKVIERISYGGVYLGGLIMLIMGITMTVTVIQRYFFSRPSYVAYELIYMLLIACTITAFPFIERTGRNIKADFLLPVMPRRVRILLLNNISPIFGLIYVGVVVWKSWEAGMYSFMIHERSQSLWGQPLYQIKFFIPVCYGLLFVVLISQLVKGIMMLKEMNPEKVAGNETTIPPAPPK
jgi:TRAP-type C4-dicarboxylate transport system permease small subunit